MLDEFDKLPLLKSNGTAKAASNERRTRERKLWHDEREYPTSLGCFACRYADICGGLSVKSSPWDCLDFCCGKDKSCNVVCPNRPFDFVQRAREVGGFRLGNVPRASKLLTSPLPNAIPILYHGSNRIQSFRQPVVCLPLAGFLSRTTSGLRFSNRNEVVDFFKLDTNTRIVLTGIDQDSSVERWWGIGDGRIELIKGLRSLGVEMVTTPNFSLIADRPRMNDLHSMNRIAITHEEFLREGMRAALHVNARTQQDWRNWTSYVSLREEVCDIAFEFATGAGRSRRKEWYLRQLIRLARICPHELHLIVRAVSYDDLATLAKAFSGVTLLETSTFLKTMHRQKAFINKSAKLNWLPQRTAPGEPLDDLLESNWCVVNACIARTLQQPNRVRESSQIHRESVAI